MLVEVDVGGDDSDDEFGADDEVVVAGNSGMVSGLVLCI